MSALTSAASTMSFYSPALLAVKLVTFYLTSSYVKNILVSAFYGYAYSRFQHLSNQLQVLRCQLVLSFIYFFIYLILFFILLFYPLFIYLFFSLQHFPPSRSERGGGTIPDSLKSSPSFCCYLE